jgi:hypothetical protein
MAGDGKQLEALVAFVERTLLPQGFEVKTNERVYNDEGVQIAELDIEIRGKVGSGNIAWLIECRDRPGKGPAPGSWIEQLVGRRTRFRFNKVTAVSTTGFAVGAIEFAHSQGIELREAKALDPSAFEDWLMVRYVVNSQPFAALQHSTILVDESETPERIRALADTLANEPTSVALLKPSKGGDPVPLFAAFQAAVNAAGTLFDDVVPNGPGKPVQLTVEYKNDEDYFFFDTSLGPIRVRSIVFCGELQVIENLVPLSVTAEYRHLEDGQAISQLAAFVPQEILGMKLSMEFHRIAESGETHIALRRVEDER